MIQPKPLPIDPLADSILRVLAAAGGRVRRRQLAEKLRNLGVASDYYSRAAALHNLEAANRVAREMRGHDSRGFQTELVVLVRATETIQPVD
jgi:hypothetical protein